jgi:hypothetical protein
MLVLGFPRVLVGLDSRTWLHTQGHIVHTDMVPVKDSSDKNSFYHVNVVYTYLPPGAKYLCNNNHISTRGFADPADNSYSLAEAKWFMRQYPVGKPVTVYYRLGTTITSTLQPGLDLGTWSGSLFGLVLLGFGTLFLRFLLLLGSRGKQRTATA